MGLSVKDLLNHLRKRQEEVGVKAFHFHHILRNHKLEPAEYPPEAVEVIEDRGKNQVETVQDDSTAQQITVKPTPKPKSPVKSTPKKKPSAKSTPSQIKQTENVVDISTSDTKTNKEDMKGGNLQKPAPLSKSIKPSASSGPKGEVMETQCAQMIDEAKHIPHLKVDTTSKYPNTTQAEVGVPAFTFPSEPTIYAHDQQHSHPVYNAMNAMNGPPVQPWPPQSIMQGPNFLQQAAPYSGPPYPITPMMNLYHTHYGLPPMPPTGHVNYIQSQHYPPAIDPHLQLPPGDPIFSIHHTGSPSDKLLASIDTPEVTRVMINGPTVAPSTSTPRKSSPLKRKRQEDDGNLTPTPTRRSGRSLKTPKKLQR